MENMEEKKVTFDEFEKAVRKKNESRKHKIKNSWGEYDFYKWLRKREWKDIGGRLTEKEFYIYMDEIFSRVADKLVEGESLKLPYRMGAIEVGKKPGMTKLHNGKIISNYQIDWQKTIKLWYEDKEAMQKKQLVRIVEKTIYKIAYLKKITPFMALFPNRTLKQRIKEAIQNNEFDAFEMDTKNNKIWNT